MPLFMPIYALLLILYVPSVDKQITVASQIYFYTPELKGMILLLFGIFLLTLIFSFFIMLKSKYIYSLEMETTKERMIPLGVTIGYSLLLYFTIKSKLYFISDYFLAIVASSIFIGIVSFIVNQYKKISLHASGVGLLTGFIIAFAIGHINFEFWIIVVCILISGLVISGRLFLKKHQPIELILGYSLSFIISILTTLYYVR